MRGEVEIWSGDNLLYEEPNMIVDGAGELLAEIMTVSPSLSGVEDHATSSILDSSNYTIQAISFGTGSDAFNKSANNAQGLLPDKLHYMVSSIWGISAGGLIGPMPLAIQDPELYASSYLPEVGLPESPNPASRVLEHNTDVSATFTGSGATLPVSSVFPGNGQHVNFLPSAIASGMMSATDFGSNPIADGPMYYPSSLGLAQSVLGAFAIGSSTQGLLNRATNRLLYKPGVVVWQSSADTFGFFNEVSSMDVSGFVNMVMSGSPNDAHGYLMSSTASGLCVSGGHERQFQSTGTFGTVEYSLRIAGGDLAVVNLYGGIYHLGLWTIDMNQSLRNGNTPPFAFSVLNNPRKYKLFARKGLSKNLCWIKDRNANNTGFSNHTDLTLKWRLRFV